MRSALTRPPLDQATFYGGVKGEATVTGMHEVRPGLTPTQFHIGNAARRFERIGDLFEGVLKKPQRLDAALEGISKIMQANHKRSV